jgi:hypothetical protein
MFVGVKHPYGYMPDAGIFQAWPPEALKMQKRCKGALKRAEKVGRPAIEMDRLRQIATGKLAYADDRNLRRLRKRLQQAERQIEWSARFDTWIKENERLGGSLISVRAALPESP